MEEITQKEAEEIIKSSRKEIDKAIEQGKKLTKTIIIEKDKITTIEKIEPVEKKSTSSELVQTKDRININS